MAITTELYGCPLFWLLVLFLSVTLSIPFLLAMVYRSVYREPNIYAHEEIPDPCWEEGCFKKDHKEDSEDDN